MFLVGSRSVPPSAIHLMDADGCCSRRLGEGYEPRWSPDGREVSYWNQADDGSVVYQIRDVNGAPPRTIAQILDPPFYLPGPAEWSPDGSKLLYAEPDNRCDLSIPPWCRPNPKAGVWTVRADGTGHQQLTTDAAAHPTWSPDGRRIAFGRRTDLVVAAADGSGQQVVHRGLGTDLILNRPSFSPDGSRIAFHLVKLGFSLQDGFAELLTVGVVNASGGAATLVSRDGPWARTRQPQWSPDGRLFAFSDAARAAVATADGSRTWTIATTNYDGIHNWYRSDPTFSPDGTWIMLGAYDPRSEVLRLHVVRPDGSELTPLVHAVGGQTPSWLP